MRYLYLFAFFGLVTVVSIFGFRGTLFHHPPMDVFPEFPFPSMRLQPKFKAQAPSRFFADGRADRPPPPHTVPTDYGPDGQPLRDDAALYEGKNPDGSWVQGFPAAITVDMKLMERGRDRFDVYCTPCHGFVGDGNGITKRYGMGATPSYYETRLMTMPGGQIFDTITHGKQPANNMPSYADKLTPRDRWAVIAYVRALQLAHDGTVADVPAADRPLLGLK